MVLPTLLKSGYVVPPKGTSKSEKERIKNQTGIDFLMNYLSDRIGMYKNGNPKIKPKKLGDKVLVLKSGTGSGKSTVIPPIFYERFQSRTLKNIAVTQPRILTAKEIAEGTPKHYPFMKLDVNIGYSTGTIKRPIKDKGILYMTTGTLLAQIISSEPDDFVTNYSLIIIDEVHERDINVDMLLYQLKKMLELYWDDPKCPFIILMSATFEPKIFMEYFESPAGNYMEFLGATFPIENNYPKFDIPNYIQYALDKAEELHVKNIIDIDENSDFRDILIFLQGGSQVKKVIDVLHLFNSRVLSKPFDEVLKYIDNKKNKEKFGGGSDKRYYIAPITLTSASFTSSGTEYQNLFSPIDNIMIPIYNLNEKGEIDINSIKKWVTPTRRIIVSTNIAETGVTIETLKYCIDTGYVNQSEFNPDFGTFSLFSKSITKGMALQRKGRVGRKSPGNWYPCYTELVFNNLNSDQFADILKSDITIHLLNVIITETESKFIAQDELTLKELENKNKFLITNSFSDNEYYLLRHPKPFNLSAVDLFEFPSSSSLVYSLEKLYSLGFIDSQYNPTVLGMYSKNFNKLSLEIIKMILSGYGYGANIMDLITISAFIRVGMRFIFSRKYKPINVLKPKISDKEYEFYYKIIICCQFTECIFIWDLYSEFLNDMMEKIRKKSKNNKSYDFSIELIEKWCAENNLEYSGLILVSKIRDEILSDVISAGFNPYYNGLDLPKGKYSLLNIIRNNLEEGVSEIKKLKKCFIDSYRLNLIIWDNKSKSYILKHRNIPIIFNKNNLIVRMTEDAVQKNAFFIIAENIMLVESKNNPGIYEFNVNPPISIIDSLDIDIKFLMH